MPKKEPLYPHVPLGAPRPRRGGGVVVRQQLGISVPRIVRDLLVHKRIMNYDEAAQFSDEVDKQLRGNDWLELYDSTTYEKTFEPMKR